MQSAAQYFVQTGDLMMRANNCLEVIEGIGNEEKTSLNLSALLRGFKISFTVLVSFFIARIWLYES